jgi:hypothetical protein
MKEEKQTNTGPKDNDHGRDEVVILIDGIEKTIHRGSHTVAQIKSLTGVSATDKLGQVIDGDLKILADDQRLTIKGGESFRVIPGGGTSS